MIAVCNGFRLHYQDLLMRKPELSIMINCLEITYQATINLNKIIDRSTPYLKLVKVTCATRPIGLGFRAWPMRLSSCASHSKAQARQLNSDVFETITAAALLQVDLAKEGAYESAPVHPFQGIFQHGMWNVKPSDRWEWIYSERLYEIRHYWNSYSAPMPTASTLANFR